MILLWAFLAWVALGLFGQVFLSKTIETALRSKNVEALVRIDYACEMFGINQYKWSWRVVLRSAMLGVTLFLIGIITFVMLFTAFKQKRRF